MAEKYSPQPMGKSKSFSPAPVPAGSRLNRTGDSGAARRGTQSGSMGMKPIGPEAYRAATPGEAKGTSGEFSGAQAGRREMNPNAGPSTGYEGMPR
jgi:hypothetical protein